METYWDAFIYLYWDRLTRVPLRKILEAFWHFTNDKKSECQEIMDGEYPQ